MGRNEIRLRQQKMSSGRIARHRNYEELMERHERGVRIRRFAVAAIYIIIFIVVLFFFVLLRKQHNLIQPAQPAVEKTTSYHHQPSSSVI